MFNLILMLILDHLRLLRHSILKRTPICNDRPASCRLVGKTVVEGLFVAPNRLLLLLFLFLLLEAHGRCLIASPFFFSFIVAPARRRPDLILGATLNHNHHAAASSSSSPPYLWFNSRDIFQTRFLLTRWLSRSGVEWRLVSIHRLCAFVIHDEFVVFPRREPTPPPPPPPTLPWDVVMHVVFHCCFRTTFQRHISDYLRLLADKKCGQ